MNPEKLQLLAQLMGALEEAVGRMERVYDKRDAEGLTKSKSEVMDLQQKISKVMEQNDI